MLGVQRRDVSQGLSGTWRGGGGICCQFVVAPKEQFFLCRRTRTMIRPVAQLLAHNTRNAALISQLKKETNRDVCSDIKANGAIWQSYIITGLTSVMLCLDSGICNSLA